MAVYKAEEIVAYYVGQDLVCQKCIEDKEMNELDADDIILQDTIEDKENLFFCDRMQEEDRLELKEALGETWGLFFFWN